MASAGSARSSAGKAAAHFVNKKLLKRTLQRLACCVSTCMSAYMAARVYQQPCTQSYRLHVLLATPAQSASIVGCISKMTAAAGLGLEAGGQTLVAAIVLQKIVHHVFCHVYTTERRTVCRQPSARCLRAPGKPRASSMTISSSATSGCRRWPTWCAPGSYTRTSGWRAAGT